MTDFEHILPLWRELEAAGADYVLATVVAVEGSSYRKPGARMLIAQDGRRAGTVSGGCLEAAVVKRAWWLTRRGPVVEPYSTLDDDGDLPYGSGCGGIVHILLERRATASPLLHQLHRAFEARAAIAIATVLEGEAIGTRAFAPSLPSHSDARAELERCAANVYGSGRSQDTKVLVDGAVVRVWVDYRPARPGLWIFGAGDDAKPLVNLARQLGWFVAVVDGRSHLATSVRFPNADQVHAIEIADLPASAPAVLDLHPTDAVVLITHSFEQDSRVLAWIFGNHLRLAYLGVLGPQRRTREALAEASQLAELNASPDTIEGWMESMHAPTGLDLGAETPASIALSILSEIQQVLNDGTARPLREVRATAPAAPAR